LLLELHNGGIEAERRGYCVTVNGDRKNFFRAFWDFFVLFSGISTASNLSRTQGRPVRNRGLFLFRNSAEKKVDGVPSHRDSPRQP
jgi:hypothetical protein